MEQSIQEAVARGAAFLDEKVPGWWRVIDVQKLDMGQCTICIMGQLFGHDVETALGAKMFELPINPAFKGTPPPAETGYERAKIALNTDYFGMDRLGCNIARACNPDEWNQLKCAWVAAIAERRATKHTDNSTTHTDTAINA